MTLRLGTRGSLLARTQSGLIADALRRCGVEVETIEITTTGDRLSREGAPIEGKGIFTRELDEALRDGRIDLAVHSLKDLPSELPSDLALAAVPPREDARDALVSRSGARLSELVSGARIGTGSPRRAAQVLVRRPGVVCLPARGNVDTRLRRLREGAWEAVILALAGLRRLSRGDEATHVLDVGEMIPAVGQGALAIVTRREPIAPVEALDDPETRAAVTAERRLLAVLEGGCRAPVAAHAWREGNALAIVAGVFALDGSESLVERRTGAFDDPAQLGESTARALLDRGAARLVAAARASEFSPEGP